MMQLLSLLTLVFMLGCGTANQHLAELTGRSVVDDELKPYVDSYFDWLDDTGLMKPYFLPPTSVRLRTNLQMEEVVGLCILPWQAVRIQKNFWRSAGPYERKALVWHELTHCVAWIGKHDDKERQIFSEYMPSEKFLEQTWEDQLRRLADIIRSN